MKNILGINLPGGHNTINPFILIKGGAENFISFSKFVFDAIEHLEIKTPDKDGTLIHAEIEIGNSTIMIADSKNDWPFTPSFIQIYVQNINNVMEKARSKGAYIVTEKTKFYGGYNIARMKDPFGNLWWLYESDENLNQENNKSDISWHERKPSYIYSTLMEIMKTINTK